MSDEFDMDEFDMDDEFPIDSDDGGDRKPAKSKIKQTAKDIVNDFKQTSVKDQIKEVSEGLIPKVVGDDVIKSVDDAKSAIKDASKGARDAGESFFSSISEIAGEESILGSAADKLAKLLGDNNSVITSFEKSNDEKSAEFANTLFEQQGKTTEIQAKMLAIQAKATDKSTKLLLQAQTQSFNLSKYGVALSERYYKKSIELKYRHILESKKQSKIFEKLYDGVTTQLGNIEKNSALPDLVKVRSSEALKAQFRQNIFNSIYQTYGGNQHWTKSLISNIKNKANSIFGGAQEGFMTAEQMAGMYQDSQGMGAGGAMAGSMGRGFLGAYLGNKFLKSSMGRKFQDEMGSFKISPHGYLEQYGKKNDTILGKMASKISNLLSPDNDIRNRLDLDIEDLNSVTSLDGRTKESINIVPTLLGNIISEIRALRTGGEPDVVNYDHRKHKLVSTKDFHKTVKADIRSGLRSVGTKNSFEEFFTTMDKTSKVKLSKREKAKLARRLYKRVDDPSFNIRHIDEDDELFKHMSEKDTKKYLNYFKTAQQEDGKMSNKLSENVEDKLRVISSTKLTIKRRIEGLVKSGFTKELMESGIITYDDHTGQYSINEKVYESITANELSRMLDGTLDKKESKDDPLRKATADYVEKFTRRTKRKAKVKAERAKRAVSGSDTYKNAEGFVNEQKEKLSKAYKDTKKAIYDKYPDDIDKANEEWGKFKNDPITYLKENGQSLWNPEQANNIKASVDSLYKTSKARSLRDIKRAKIKAKRIQKSVNSWASKKYLDVKTVIEEQGYSLDKPEEIYNLFKQNPKEFSEQFGREATGLFKDVGQRGLVELAVLYQMGEGKFKSLKDNYNAADIKGTGSSFFTKFKNKLINKMPSKSKDDFLTTLTDLLSSISPKRKLGDADGDGDRDGSWRDIFSRNSEKKSSIKDEKNIKKEDKKSGGILGMLMSMLGLGGSVVGMGVGMLTSIAKPIISLLSKGVFGGMSILFKRFGLTSVFKILGTLPRAILTLGTAIGTLGTKMGIPSANGPMKGILKYAGVAAAGYGAYEYFHSDVELTSTDKSALKEVEALHKRGIPFDKIDQIIQSKYKMSITELKEKADRSNSTYGQVKDTALGLGVAYGTNKVIDGGLSGLGKVAKSKGMWNNIGRYAKKGGKLGALAGIAYGAYKIFSDDEGGSDVSVYLNNKEREALTLVRDMNSKGYDANTIDIVIKRQYGITLSDLKGKIDNGRSGKTPPKTLYDVGANNMPHNTEGWAELIKNQANMGLAVAGVGGVMAVRHKKELMKTAKTISQNAKRAESTTVLTKSLPKMLKGKSGKFISKIPGVGSLASFGIAASDIAKGNYASAMMNVLLGVTKASPVGMALGIASMFLPDDKTPEEKKKEEELKVKKEIERVKKLNADGEAERKQIREDKVRIDDLHRGYKKGEEYLLPRTGDYGMARNLYKLDLGHGSGANEAKFNPIYVDKNTPGGLGQSKNPNGRYIAEKQKYKDTILKPNGGGSLCGLKFKHKVIPSIQKRHKHRKRESTKYIVMHWTAGSRLQFATAKKTNCAAQLWIDKDGTIWLLNDIDDFQWAVGVTEKMPSVRNSNSISIEMVGSPPGKINEAPTKAQVASMKKLVGCLMAKYGLTTDDLRYHGELTARKHPLEGKRYVEILKGVNYVDEIKQYTKANQAVAKAEKMTKTMPKGYDPQKLAVGYASGVMNTIDKKTPNIPHDGKSPIANEVEGTYTNKKGVKKSFSIPAKDKMLLEFLSQREGGKGSSGYDTSFGRVVKDKLTNKTISEIYDIQDQIYAKTKNGKHPSTAVGKYQFLKKVLKEEVKRAGLSDNTLFTPEVQDYLFLNRLKKMRHYDQWLNGTISNKEFGRNISMELASFEDPYKGTGHYAKGKHPQKAHVSFDSLNTVLNKIKNGAVTTINNVEDPTNITSAVVSGSSAPVDSSINNNGNLVDNSLMNTPLRTPTTQPIDIPTGSIPVNELHSITSAGNEQLVKVVGLLTRMLKVMKSSGKTLKTISKSPLKTEKHVVREVVKDAGNITGVATAQTFTPPEITDISKSGLRGEGYKRKY